MVRNSVGPKMPDLWWRYDCLNLAEAAKYRPFEKSCLHTYLQFSLSFFPLFTFDKLCFSSSVALVYCLTLKSSSCSNRWLKKPSFHKPGSSFCSKGDIAEVARVIRLCSE